MSTLFFTVFGASLVGSLHCAGMCGPLVAVYAADAQSERLRAHSAYHGGRLATYATLGGLAGGLGSLVDFAGTLMGIATLAGAMAGATVAAWGAFKLLSLYDTRWSGMGAPRGLQRLAGRVLARLRRHPPTVRALVMGLSSALLPCGWLYAFIAVAAGAATVSGGATVMLAFWLGTLPALAAVGEGVRRLAGPFAKRLPVLSALALIVVGLGTVWMRVGKTQAMDRWLDTNHGRPSDVDSPSGKSVSVRASEGSGVTDGSSDAVPKEHHCH